MGGQLDEHLLCWQPTISIILYFALYIVLLFEIQTKYDDDDGEISKPVIMMHRYYTLFIISVHVGSRVCAVVAYNGSGDRYKSRQRVALQRRIDTKARAPRGTPGNDDRNSSELIALSHSVIIARD